MVHLDATWQAVLQRATYPPSVRSILGEALAACALLSATIKFEGSLIMQIRGDGPLHLLVVQASPEGTLRGIARWQERHSSTARVLAYTPALSRLIELLSRMPGIGEKTAARLAFFILKSEAGYGRELADAIRAVKDNTRFCTSCWALSETEPCGICTDSRRDVHLLVVDALHPRGVARAHRPGGTRPVRRRAG